MHVLIIPSWYPRYAGDIRGSFFREQALALHKHGCKVGVIYPELLSLRNWKSVLTGQKKILTENDKGVLTYRSHGMNWFPQTVEPATKLFVWHGKRLFDRYVADNGVPDIVHVHSLLNAGPLAATIYEEKGVPFVVTEHNSGFARKLISEKGLCLARKSAALAHRRFAVSSEFSKLLNETIGSERAKWDELPNIVSDIFIKHPLTINKSSHSFNFINVAMMNENKRQNNIIHAFAKINQNHKNTYLTMVGDGPERNKLVALAIELGVEKSVKFTGLLSREAVLSAMANADAFVLSSRYETFSVVVIEALALGKPVIATRCGGPESIVRQEDGVLVPVDDVSALTNAMAKIIKDQKNYDPQEIRQACINRYSETAIANQLIKIYSSAMTASTGHNQ